MSSKKKPRKTVSAPSRARRPSKPVRKPSPPPAAPPTDLGGRPSVYNSTLHARICALVEAGVPISCACRQEGIGRRTLYDWRKRGATGEQPYAALNAELDAALARSEARVVSLVVASTAEDWKAGAWWLERRFPKRYSAKQQLKIEKAPTDMTDAELDAAIALHGYVRATPTESPDTTQDP